jgi:hypothetical protein
MTSYGRRIGLTNDTGREDIDLHAELETRLDHCDVGVSCLVSNSEYLRGTTVLAAGMFYIQFATLNAELSALCGFQKFEGRYLTSLGRLGNQKDWKIVWSQ